MTAAPPERTCVGCRARAAKPALVRVVRSPSGEVAVDRTGKAAGRGAYVHPARSCVQTAAARGALGRALRVRLDTAEATRLMGEVLEGAGAER